MGDEIDYDYEEGNDDGPYDLQSGKGGGEEEVDADEMLKRMKEMDDELQTITSTQKTVEGKLNQTSASLDENSIFIGQVDYEATAEELRALFAPCGTINRITIPTGPGGRAKGYAYIEFDDKVGVDKALAYDDTPFKGRPLKVLPKRNNASGDSGGDRGGRGGFRGGGRGGFRGGGRGRFSPGRRGGFRGRGGRFSGRGRGRGHYNSYY